MNILLESFSHSELLLAYRDVYNVIVLIKHGTTTNLPKPVLYTAYLNKAYTINIHL